jgi:hypothetical protein
MNYLPGRENHAFHQELANYKEKTHFEQLEILVMGGDHPMPFIPQM